MNHFAATQGFTPIEVYDEYARLAPESVLVFGVQWTPAACEVRCGTLHYAWGVTIGDRIGWIGILSSTTLEPAPYFFDFVGSEAALFSDDVLDSVRSRSYLVGNDMRAYDVFRRALIDDIDVPTAVMVRLADRLVSEPPVEIGLDMVRRAENPRCETELLAHLAELTSSFQDLSTVRAAAQTALDACVGG